MKGNLFGTREFTGRHMIGVMVLFFGTIISVNLTLAFFANTTWTGLVVQNTYVESQRFNAVTRDREAMQRLGWTPQLTHGDGRLTLTITDAQDIAVNDLAVSATLGRPVHENDDMTLTFQPQGEGVYVAQANLSAGEWVAQLEAAGRGDIPWKRAVRFRIGAR